jgi:putative membrane protein
MSAAATYADPWAFEANPEVYLLVAFFIGAYIYMVRSIGPSAVAPGQPVVTRRERVCFVASMVVLFVASTFPVHQIGEDYLYFVHMIQHFLLSYVLPPLILLATPEWLLRTLIGNGRMYRVVRFFARPVVAAVILAVSLSRTASQPAMSPLSASGIIFSSRIFWYCAQVVTNSSSLSGSTDLVR